MKCRNVKPNPLSFLSILSCLGLDLEWVVDGGRLASLLYGVGRVLGRVEGIMLPLKASRFKREES